MIEEEELELSPDSGVEKTASEEKKEDRFR